MNHYVYLIRNLYNFKNNIFPYDYIGSRSCECDVNLDNYMGSSEILYFDILRFGIINFKKKIIKKFSNRNAANLYEYNLLKKRNVLYNEKYYNISYGSKTFIKKSKNIITAYNTITNKYVSVTKETFNFFNYLVGINKDRIYINKNNKNKIIKLYDLELYLNDGWVKGKIINTIQITNNIKNKNINKSDLELYLNNGWRIGRTNFKKHKIWITDGVSSKMVEKNEIPINWHRGRCECGTKNKIQIIKDNLTKFIIESDLELYLNDGWVRGKEKRFWITKNKKDKFIIESDLELYLNDGWVKGKEKTGNKNNLLNRKCITNGKETKLLSIEKCEEFLLLGWTYGRHKRNRG